MNQLASSSPLWRLINLNPLIGLSAPRLVSHFHYGERGQYADLQWLYRFIEKRDAVVRAVKRRLSNALTGLDWSIKPMPGYDENDPDVKKQSKELKEAYDKVSNLRKALTFLALADLRGFAHLEKIYAGENAGTGADPWDVTELRIVPQWHWVRDGLYGDWCYNEEALQWLSPDNPVNPEHFVIRDVDDPADEIFTICFLRKNTNEKDWDGFLETYGIPPIFIEGPPNVPKEKEGEYQSMAEKVVSDTRGYIPNGAKVHTLTGREGATNPFSDRLKYLDEMIVIAGTSGKLTVLNEATGIGGSQGKVHQDTFNEVAAAQAAQVSEIMQEHFDRVFLQRKFPNQQPMVYFEFAPVDEEDTQAHVDNAQKLGQAGYDIDLEQLGEKSGYKLSRRAAPAPAQNSLPQKEAAPAQQPDTAAKVTAPQPAGKPVADAPATSSSGEADPQLVQNAIAADLGVQARWLAPLNQLFSDLIAKANDGTLDDAALAAAVKQAQSSMPELLGELNVAELQGAIEKAIGPAAVKGATDAIRAKVQPAA